MWAAVWLVAVSLEIVQKHGPKRVAASLDQASREMLPEHAKAVSLELYHLVANHVNSAWHDRWLFGPKPEQIQAEGHAHGLGRLRSHWAIDGNQDIADCGSVEVG